jgi:hypothetical protein
MTNCTTMKKIILALVLLLLLNSCFKSKEVSKIIGTDWLLGKWENKSTDGNLQETWKRVNDSLFIGESYFIQEKDTLHSEKMELKQKGENLLYISTIKGENNDKPLTFTYNTEIEKQLVFENPKANYPRKIKYTPYGADRLIIEISGIEQNKPTTAKYSMKKTTEK